MWKKSLRKREYTLRAANISIREAHSLDIPKLHMVLTQVRLSTEELLVSGTRYWLAEDSSGQPVGVVGLELEQDAVLLRSAAISPALQGQGLGTSLVQHVMGEALAAGYRSMYLFSTGAGEYWQQIGFHEVPVSELVEALPNAPQVMQYKKLGWLSTEVAWRRDLDR